MLEQYEGAEGICFERESLDGRGGGERETNGHDCEEWDRIRSREDATEEEDVEREKVREEMEDREEDAGWPVVDPEEELIDGEEKGGRYDVEQNWIGEDGGERRKRHFGERLLSVGEWEEWMKWRR